MAEAKPTRLNLTEKDYDGAPSTMCRGCGHDAISAFRGPSMEIHATLIRLADICKSRGITALFTSLTSADDTMTGDAA